MSWKLLPWFLFGIFLGIVRSSLACSQIRLLNCMQPVKKFGDMTRGLSGVFNPEQIKSFCSVTVNALNCAKDEWPNCPDNVKLLWQAMDSGLSFLCTNKLDEFLSYSDCWKQTIVNETAYGCQTMLQEEMRSYQIAAQGMDSYERKKEGCRVIYKYIACINGIDQYCKKEAVNLLSEMVERMVQPTMNILQCDPKVVLVHPDKKYVSRNKANTWQHQLSTSKLLMLFLVTMATVTIASGAKTPWWTSV